MKVDCRPVLALRPTQFSLGMEQVKHKTQYLANLSRKKLAAYLHERIVPVVVAPQRDLYIIDRHHLLYCCWQIGIKEVEVDIHCDLSQTDLSHKKFWRTMVRSHWAYLYDQFGDGPRDPLYLPVDIRGLADDPYRSLAWAVRERGAYENVPQTFAEFEWADFFRRKKLLESRGREHFDDAIDKGIRLAKSPQAKGLPGYKGKSSVRKVQTATRMAVAA